MKKLISMLLVVSTLVVLLSMPALALSVNVRSGPGLTYSSLGTLKGGAKITVLSTKKDSRGVTWCKIKFKSGYGWVSSRYVSGYSGTSSSQKGKSSGGVRATSRTNVRSGPGLSYKSLTTMQKGDSATYLGSSKKDSRGVKWYKVSYGGVKGWVSSRYTVK